jgi:hypothetical protein
MGGPLHVFIPQQLKGVRAFEKLAHCECSSPEFCHTEMATPF